MRPSPSVCVLVAGSPLCGSRKWVLMLRTDASNIGESFFCKVVNVEQTYESPRPIHAILGCWGRCLCKRNRPAALGVRGPGTLIRIVAHRDCLPPRRAMHVNAIDAADSPAAYVATATLKPRAKAATG